MKCLLLAVFLSLSVLSASANPGDSSTSGAEPDVQFSEEAYFDDASTIGDYNEIVAGVSEAFGPRLAFLAIDRDVSPSVIRVGVVDQQPEDWDRLATATSGNTRVRLRSATYSMDEVEAFFRSTADVLGRNDIAIVRLVVDYSGQQVIASLESPLPAQVEAELHEEVPAAAVSWITGESLTTT